MYHRQAASVLGILNILESCFLIKQLYPSQDFERLKDLLLQTKKVFKKMEHFAQKKTTLKIKIDEDKNGFASK